VNLHRCPYDGTPIEAETYSGGSVLLSCSFCGAHWEAHNALVHRVQEPDWQLIERARTETAAIADPTPSR
jgi:hypothetical protein